MTGILDGTAATWVIDLVELALAALAAVSCARRAARVGPGHARRGWAWLAAGCASWAGGQVVWSAYELVLRRAIPLPSLADAGFLGFAVCVVVAMFVLPPSVPGDRRRRLLDGLAMVVALSTVSWATVLGAVLHAGGDSPVGLAVSLAYPASDVLVLTMAVLALAQGSRDRGSLTLVGAGLLAMAVADSAFAYSSAVGTFETGWVDLGWCGAFLLLALAGRLEEVDAGPRTQQVVGASALPYVVLLSAGAVVLHAQLSRRVLDLPLVWLSVALVAVVIARQWTALLDNQSLARTLADREAQLRHQAFHDSLTGLANRDLFTDSLRAALARCAADARPLVVGFLDLDGFKAVNDSAGHASGDALLVQVAERLRHTVGSGGMLARLGGDEFGLLLEGCADTDAVRVAESVVDAVRAPFALLDRTVRLSASLGLAAYRPGSALPSVGDLLTRADVAMYDVKRSGKNGVRLHCPGVRLDEADDLVLRPALEAAIAAGEVRAVFQPVVSLADDTVTGYEVLARWTHEGEVVPPPVFVGVAERTGLGPALTDLMVEHALGQLARWRATDRGTDVVVGVNISPTELVDPGLPGRVRAALARHGVPARQLLLEVTESALLLNPSRARAAMDDLHTDGVTFALDDFGTGYSSLSQLLELPLDTVKVDRAFVTEIDTNVERQRFLEGVLSLTAYVGLRVVAEGIERPGQLEELRRMGCTWGQGYLLGRPADAGQLTPPPAGRVTVPLPR